MALIDKFPVSGLVAPGFEPVRAAFDANFTRRGEVGAAVHVLIDGEPVVDLWGGAADAAGTRPWEADTLVNVWSTTKGWLALAMHMLAERGLLDFEAPVARYWPEFARHGKDRVLVRHILTHTAGLPGPSLKVPDEAVYDWQVMTRSLEQSELFWKPGTRCGYHAATFGWLNGEVLRRITGLSVGQFLYDQISVSLGADAFIGVPASQEGRTADTLPPDPVERLIFNAWTGLPGRLARQAFHNPHRPLQAVNTHRWREAQIPSSNGHCSARGLARLYTPLALGGEAFGVRLLAEKSVERLAREQIHVKDVITTAWVRRTLGFMLPDTELGDPRPLTAFGHPGMGGSLGFADPLARLAVGYVRNKMLFGSAVKNYSDLCRAVYACLDPGAMPGPGMDANQR